MSIKTVRSRIREGQITTIDEFERDVMLIFAYVPFSFLSWAMLMNRNAIMYNSRGSGVYDMAVEMMKDAEVHIKHLKNVQLQHSHRS
jgi:bromodomain-containing protein 8